MAPGGNGSKGDGKWDGQEIILERCEVCSERHAWRPEGGKPPAPGRESRARGETKQCAHEAQCVVCGQGGTMMRAVVGLLQTGDTQSSTPKPMM